MRGQVVFPERLNCSRSTLSSAGQREEAFKAVYLRQMCDKCQRGFNYSFFVAKFYTLKLWVCKLHCSLQNSQFHILYFLLPVVRGALEHIPSMHGLKAGRHLGEASCQSSLQSTFCMFSHSSVFTDESETRALVHLHKRQHRNMTFKYKCSEVVQRGTSCPVL